MDILGSFIGVHGNEIHQVANDMVLIQNSPVGAARNENLPSILAVRSPGDRSQNTGDRTRRWRPGKSLEFTPIAFVPRGTNEGRPAARLRILSPFLKARLI
jgi:hypothetical protein